MYFSDFIWQVVPIAEEIETHLNETNFFELLNGQSSEKKLETV